MSKQILIVAAHSDDEALGCGGTMAQHAWAGDEVHVIFLTQGVASRSGCEPEEVHARREAARKASQILGVASVTQLDFPDNQLDTVPLLAVVKAVEEVADRIQPDLVYTHHGGDLNVDHRICHQAVLTAFRAIPGQTALTLLGFEVCSSTEWAYEAFPRFIPQRYVDIEKALEAKMDALAAYSMEMRAFPHARSLESVRALAVWRGASVGRAAAEAFTIIRDIQIPNVETRG